jgi:hypothetical protein
VLICCTDHVSLEFSLSWYGYFTMLSGSRLHTHGCGVLGGMRIVRRNRNSAIKPAPFPHLPDDRTWDRSRTSAMGSRRLTSLSYDAVGRYFYIVTTDHGTLPIECDAQKFRVAECLTDITCGSTALYCGWAVT